MNKHLVPVILILTLFFSCQSPTGKATSSPTGCLVVSWGSGTGHSTIAPVLPALDHYTVGLQHASDTPITAKAVGTASSVSFTNLVAQVYSVTVTGYTSVDDSSPVVSGTGSADLTVSDALVPLTLSVLSSGTGTGNLNLTLDFSQTTAITSATPVSLLLTSPSGTIQLDNTSNLTGTFPQYHLALNWLPLGSYKLLIQFTTSTSQTVVENDSILIAKNLTTTKTVAFTNGDLVSNYVPVSAVTLNKTSQDLMDLPGFNNFQLRAAVTGSNPKLTWSSDNTSAATVTTNGLVCLVGPGTAHISARSAENPTKVDTCTVSCAVVYTAGNAGSGTPGYWLGSNWNGVFNPAGTDNCRVAGIKVSGGGVYMVGTAWVGGGSGIWNCVYWNNGSTATRYYSGHTFGSALDFDGTNPHITGFAQTLPGTNFFLISSSSSTLADLGSPPVSGADQPRGYAIVYSGTSTYIGGGQNGQAQVWVNNTPTTISTGSVVYGLAVSGSTIYAVGTSGGTNAKLWISDDGGTSFTHEYILASGTANVQAVKVVLANSQLYMAGCDGTNGVYWVFNGSTVTGPTALWGGQATSLAVWRGHIFVSGTNFPNSWPGGLNNSAGANPYSQAYVWVDGVQNTLGSGSPETVATNLAVVGP